jgi:GNAT superfamily N-acetyltransferase
VFKRYHYLNHDINKAARVWVATVNGDLCAFTSVLPFVGKLKNTWRGHRTVVLPDFQGIGLASILTNFVGDLLIAEGKHYITQTSNPKLIHARANDPHWITYRIGHCRGTGITRRTTSYGRVTASFRYVGDKKPPE